MVSEYQWILDKVPAGMLTDLVWILSPYVALVLCGVLSYLGRCIPAALCGLFTVAYWFVVIVDQVVTASASIEEEYILSSVVDIVPILFLVGGLLAVSAISFYRRYKVVEGRKELSDGRR